MHTKLWWVGLLVVLSAPVGVRAGGVAPYRVPDTLAQRLQPCVQCHGKEGRATASGYFPRIAGKPAAYLYQQLLNFRDGRRHNPTMSALVAPLSDAYLQEMAGYFASLELPYPPPPVQALDTQQRARGALLVQQGDGARRIPACTACHGAAMTGVLPAVPGLLGLPRDYLMAQLGAWQAGQRHAAAPDCMAQVARQLSSQDLQAVAAWLSAQPLPADTRPAPRAGAPLPLVCGSVSAVQP